MISPLWIEWVKTSATRWDTDCGKFACVRRPTGMWYVLSVLPDGEFAERVTPYGTTLRVLALARSASDAMKQFDQALNKKIAHKANLEVSRPFQRQVKVARKPVSMASQAETLRLPSPLNPTKTMWEAVFKPRVVAKFAAQGVMRACQPPTSLTAWRAKKELQRANPSRSRRHARGLVAALA